MFVRVNESGGRRYLQVVESYRNEAGKPRHRIVANLGRIDGMEDGHLDALIRGLCRAAGRDEPAKLEITHAPARAFGDVFALHELWKDLGFDRALGWPKGPEAAYLGFWENKGCTVHASERSKYMTTFSAGILNPRPSDTRSVLIGYFGRFGLIPTIRWRSPPVWNVRP